MRKSVLLMTACVLIGGCAQTGGPEPDGGFVARLQSLNPIANMRPDRALREDTTRSLAAQSAVIQELSIRRTALPETGPYAQVAHSVLAAKSRTSEAELRAAKLRAEAASTNWLPRIGPEISLTSLSSVVASLVLDVTLFDHGRKKAEREFAKADVEVAAVTLAEDSNDRVFTALELYLAMQEGHEGTRHDMVRLRDMQQFLHVMNRRVRGGVSDASDLNVIHQKVAEIQASLRANTESARTALAELNAMSVEPLDDVSGLSEVPVQIGSVRPLQVVRADAEKGRRLAQATISRADALPGITASGRIGDNDGASVTAGGTFGVGTGAQLKSIEATRQAAESYAQQAQEDASRTLRRLDSAMRAADRQAAEAAKLTTAAKATLDLFQQQFEGGQRQVMDVVQVYETYARQQERQIVLRYEAARLRLDLARVLGVLVDGEAI